MSHIADATNEPDRASRRIANWQPTVLDPSVVSIARLDAVFARDLDGFPPEAFPQRVAVDFGIIWMNP